MANARVDSDLPHSLPAVAEVVASVVPGLSQVSPDAVAENAHTGWLQQIFDHIDEAYCIVRLAQRKGKADVQFLEVNQAFYRQTGLSKVEGAWFRDRVPEPDESWFNRLQDCVSTGQPQSYTHTDELNQKWFELYAARIEGARGEQLIGIISRDVSEAKAQDQSQRFFAEIHEIIRSSDEPTEVEKSALAAIANFLTSDCCFISLTRSASEGEQPRPMYLVGEKNSSDISDSSQIQFAEFIGSSFLRAHLGSGQVYVTSDITRETRLKALPSFLTALEVRAFAAVPVFRGGRWSANLVLYWKTPRFWRGEDIRSLQSAAHQVWASLEKKRALKEVRASDERFRALADAIPQLAWMTDSAGSIFWYNQRWYDYTGTSFEEMKGWGWQKVHHPDHVDRVTEKYKHCIDHAEPWEDLFPLRSADGQYRWFLSRARPTRDASGKISLWVGTNTDVTEQMQAQADLKAKQTLLTAANRKKSEFLAVLSHELRNPLAPIHTAVQMLDSHSSFQPGELDKVTKTLRRQVDQLVHLVDDLLDLSRIERGKLLLRRSKVAVRDIVEQAIEASRYAADRGHHQIVTELSPTILYVNADTTRLVQVIANLLTNAARYTNTPGTIRVSTAAENGRAVIRVKDQGIGVPVEAQAHIFDMFAQVHDKNSRSQEGLGIGLALSKQLVEMHGGQISVSSEGDNRGSEFTVILPLLTSSLDETPNVAPASDAKAQTSISGPKRKILIVDDNEDAAELLALSLRRVGHVVHLATNGQEAFSLAEQLLPEVVLMDIGMPVMDGFTACTKIRQTSWGKSMVIVALTGWGQQEDIAQTRAVGFNHHLTKPVSTETLEVMIRAA